MAEFGSVLTEIEREEAGLPVSLRSQFRKFFKVRNAAFGSFELKLRRKKRNFHFLL